MLAFAGCGVDFDLPPLVASSEYIAYHTDADAAVICMDDLLAHEDQFIERTAALLGVDPPSSPIDFVWDPIMDSSAPWACPGTDGCYHSKEGDDLSVIVSPAISHPHEFVHAIEIQALGLGHPTLMEGLAEYLGATRATPPGASFPERFKAMIAKSPKPDDDYTLAMHFVGSIFARHGAAKYLELRAKMPENAKLGRFAEVFAAVYGQSLDDALVEISGEPVYGLLGLPGCEDGEAREIPWTSEGLIDTSIESSCGDPWFAGGGFVDGRPGFYGYYIIEVPEAGFYELTVAGGALVGLVAGCTFDLLQSAVGSFDGATGHKLLQSGRHRLAITFPPRPQARGEATVRLEYVGPPP